MPHKEEHPSEPVFKVTDRRKFTIDGDLRTDSDATPEPPQQAAPPPLPPSLPAPQAAAAAAPAPQEQKGAEETDFADDAAYAQDVQTPFGRLVLSLTQTAMMQLGLVAVDPTQPLEPDLMGARDTIDMLGILEEKTKGNLSQREAALLTNTLGELRMAFMAVQRRFVQPPR